jgi:RecA-family ATPase
VAFTLDELLAYKEEREYWIYPFLPKLATMVIGAPPKHYKTILAMQFAYSLAEGVSFFGWNVRERARILYVEQEIGTSETRDRMRRMQEHYQGTERQMAFQTRSKVRVSLDEGTKGINKMVELIETHKPNVVVLDPFRKMTAKDENSSGDMTKVFGTLTALQETYGLSVVIIHHSAKSSEFRKAGEPESLRGSSEIFAHGDTYCILEKPGDKKSTLVDAHFTFRHASDIDTLQLDFDKSTGIFRKKLGNG